MPGPFPGMDPYLESPRHWRNVHESMIPYMRDMLNSSLPSGYVATINERLCVIPGDRKIYPDLTVIRSVDTAKGRGGTATLATPDSYLHIASLLDEVPGESYIEIITADSDRRVVTVVELLSPTNKAPGSGHEEYRAKQREALHSQAHFIEIDLLRAGRHTAAADHEEIRKKRPGWHYLVSLHRAEYESGFDVWAWSVRDRMPRIAIPLEPGVPDVVLDLQTPFDRNYDAGRFPQQIDYRKDPDPPFTGEDAAWIDSLLREKGLRD